MSHTLTAYSANRKIEGLLREEHRKLDKQQIQMLARIGREKTELFDTLIHLNVRTPCLQASSPSERVTLTRMTLETTDRPKSLNFPLGTTRRQHKPKLVTPVIDVHGTEAYCQLEEDLDTRKKLEANSRTRHLLMKTANIWRGLETVNVRAYMYGSPKKPEFLNRRLQTSLENVIKQTTPEKPLRSKTALGFESFAPKGSLGFGVSKVKSNKFESNKPLKQKRTIDIKSSLKKNYVNCTSENREFPRHISNSLSNHHVTIDSKLSDEVGDDFVQDLETIQKMNSERNETKTVQQQNTNHDHPKQEPKTETNTTTAEEATEDNDSDDDHNKLYRRACENLMYFNLGYWREKSSADIKKDSSHPPRLLLRNSVRPRGIPVLAKVVAHRLRNSNSQ